MESDPFKGRQTLLPSGTLFTLLEKQAKEFETFGKRMSLDIQNSYKIYVQQNELNKTSELNNILGKQQCQLESQSHLIDSLRSRIEELENDSIKKNNEINRIKKDFLDFKKEIKLLFGLENSTQSFDLNNLKKVNSLFEGNDSDEFEFIHSEAKYSDSKQIIKDLAASNDNNDDDDNNIKQSSLTTTVENIRLNGSSERLIAENNQSNEIDINKERLIFKNIQSSYGINGVLPIPPTKDQNVENKSTIVENKKTSIFGSVLFDEYFYNHSTFTDYSESSTSVKSSSNDKYDSERSSTGRNNDSTNQEKENSSSPKSKSEEFDSKDESNEESLSDNQLDEELEEDIKYNPSQRSFKDSNNNLNQKLRNLLLDLKASNRVNSFNYSKQTSSPRCKDNISCLPPISIKSSTSQNKPIQGSQRTPTVIEQIQAEVQYTIARFQEQNTKVKQKTFNYLLNQFTLESLIKYQETNYYNVLARDPKRSIKLMVKTALRSELCNKDKRVTQPIEEYVKRKIIPSLPPGIKSYTEYEKTSYFVKLSDEKKKRIRKIVTVELN